jgi:hypothetical protein
MQFLSVLDLSCYCSFLILLYFDWLPERSSYFRMAWLSKLFKICLISLLWNGFCCCWTLILVSWQASCLSLVMISQLSSMSTLPLHHMQQCQVDWSIPLYLFAPLFGSKSMVKEKREQVLRSTGHSSTIRIEENDFDEYKSCNLRLGFSSTWKEQL